MLPYGGRRHSALVEDAPAVQVSGLTLGYPGHPVLRSVSLSLPAGSRYALVGDNGAGKSTLLKAIGGVLRPATTAQISIFGCPVETSRHRIAYLPQRSEIDWSFPVNVVSLVMTGRYVHLGWLQRPRLEDKETAFEALEMCGVAHLARRQIGQLSGGQQQRVLLARALAQEADLLLLDEPYAALDEESRSNLEATLQWQGAHGKTLLIATHDLANSEHLYDGVLTLKDGHVDQASSKAHPEVVA